MEKDRANEPFSTDIRINLAAGPPFLRSSNISVYPERITSTLTLLGIIDEVMLQKEEHSHRRTLPQIGSETCLGTHNNNYPQAVCVLLLNLSVKIIHEGYYRRR